MTSNIRKCLLCWEISYFLRNNNFFEELQLENTSSNVPNFLYMNSAWYIFRTHARDFESSLKFLRNLENKICTLAETRYFCFTNYLKNDKNVENCGHAFFTTTKSYLSTKMRYIWWCLLYLKLVKTLICSQKRPGFPVKINISVKKCDFDFFLFFAII